MPDSILAFNDRDPLPFVVRLSPWRFAWASVRRMMYWFMLPTVPIAIFISIMAKAPVGLILVAVMAVVPLAMMPPLMLAVRRVPVIRAGKAGLWINVLAAKQAVFLQWTDIAKVAIRRVIAHDALCVVVRDPALDGALPGQAVARQRVLAAAGTYIYTPLTGSGLSNEDALATLRGYAAGRCPVG